MLLSSHLARRMNINMCRVIAVANQKGGVGKTVTCVNLGIGLAREGQRENSKKCDRSVKQCKEFIDRYC